MDRKSLSVLFLLWLIGWGPWISASVSDEGAGGQARPAEEPSSSGTDAGRDPENAAPDMQTVLEQLPKDPQANFKLAGWYHQRGQYPRMIAALEVVWENDPELILREASRIGQYYADARQGDSLIRRIEKLDDAALLERYGDRLGQFAVHFAHRGDQTEVAGRVYAAIMKVLPIRSRCGLAQEYGDFLVRQSRLPEAYEVYKLGFFPAPSDAKGGAYAVPEQRHAATFMTGEVLSPIIALADLAVDTQASDRLRADVRAAVQHMPEWKLGGDLLLAMLSRREGNEQPLADLGSRCVDDTAFRARTAKLMPVLRQELSRCDGAEPLGIAESLWRESEEKASDYEADAALHQQALIKVKLGNPEQARQLWLRIVDRLGKAKGSIEQDIQSRSFVAEQLLAHGFPVDALRLARQILQTDRSRLPSDSYVLYMIQQTERRLIETLQKSRARDFKFAEGEEEQVLAILLGLLFGEGAQKDAELGPGLEERTTICIAESVVSFAKTTGQLARLRQQWDARPMADSLNLLALRAEAAMTDGDQQGAEQLLARISDLEQRTGQTAPLWSPACLFWGLDQKFKAEFRDGLRGSKLDERVFGIMPAQKARELRQYVQPGPDGLHLRVPPGSGPVGVWFKPVLRGDFEVTASYAIWHATQPDGTHGPGAALRVWTREGKGQLAGFFAVNGLPADQGGGYVMNRGHIQEGKHEIREEYAAGSASHGMLRVVRKGATLYFLAAEEDDSEFRRLHQIEFSDQDIVGIRLGVHPVDPNAGMDVRWQDLVVRAEQIVGMRGEAPSREVASVIRRGQSAGTSGAARSPKLASEPPEVSPALRAEQTVGNAGEAQPSERASEPGSWLWWSVPVLILSLAGIGVWWFARARKGRIRAESAAAHRAV